MLPLKTVQTGVNLCGELLRVTGVPPDIYAEIVATSTIAGVEVADLCAADVFYVGTLWTAGLNPLEAEMFWPLVSEGRWLEGLEVLQCKLSKTSEPLSWWVAATLELMTRLHPVKKPSIAITPSIN